MGPVTVPAPPRKTTAKPSSMYSMKNTFSGNICILPSGKCAAPRRPDNDALVINANNLYFVGFIPMLFDKSNTYILEAGLLPYVAHAFDEEDLKYNKRTLLDPVIKYYTGPSGTITYIDLKNRKFKTQDGKEYSYDYLVIALGCTYDISQPPGLKDDYHTYYEFEKAKELREMLERFTGGSIVQMVYMYMATVLVFAKAFFAAFTKVLRF